MADRKFTINENGFQCGAQMTCPRCGNTDMDGHGGSFGGRITTYKRRCPKCECTLLIVPMKKEYEYVISAKTRDEQEETWKKRRKLKELEEEAENLRRQLNID